MRGGTVNTAKTIKELRESIGMSRKEFSEHTGIPVRTLEFLGLWEQLHNSTFKGVEFDAFRNQAGSNAFTMSPSKWIDATNAIGIVSKSGRYGGTFAHSDIAFEFASRESV